MYTECCLDSEWAIRMPNCSCLHLLLDNKNNENAAIYTNGVHSIKPGASLQGRSRDNSVNNHINIRGYHKADYMQAEMPQRGDKEGSGQRAPEAVQSQNV